MIQLHIDILKNLQQAIFLFNIPISADCRIQTDQVIIVENEDVTQQHCQTIIHLNDLIIDINKGSEVPLSESEKINTQQGQVRRTFKFPYVHLPHITEKLSYDINSLKCAKCQSALTIISENENLKIIQDQNANIDDLNELIYCHRFCNAHQHEHKHEHRLYVPPDLHSERILIETTDRLILSNKYLSTNLIQCNICLSKLGILNNQTNLVSLDKCLLQPFSFDFIASCFRHNEPGRYIVKIAKSNDSIFLVWILPNDIFSADLSNSSEQLEFHRMRKILFTRITSTNDKLFNDWKRDFSVTTLLINQLCFDHLSKAFEEEITKFPNLFNTKEQFQSLTISF